mmetsp:Transcript_39782/g.124263  ORF Transcript_39782/g.124263 Transcript_39782/m.124263 type:complete len:333 (-) Transcript_39782:2485-3483(-)
MRLGVTAIAALAGAAAAHEHRNELRTPLGHTQPNNYELPLPHTYINAADLPDSFNWGNMDGMSYLTKNLNQHIPQYCGSCWAHGALSSLADRIKIARKGQGIEINLSVQYILNCGTDIAGSCHGGSHSGTYEFITKSGHVPYDTCLVYEACSADSTEGTCAHGNYECSAINKCRTCSTFTAEGGFCSEIDFYPNATIAEYGTISGEKAIMSEIYARGPVAAEVNASPLHNYENGIFDDPTAGKEPNHIVSIVGWGTEAGTPYWIVRNSWGEYWGEMGYFRIKRGENQLFIEGNCAWATPGTWTEQNVPCYEDGKNCVKTGVYEDPAKVLAYA